MKNMILSAAALAAMAGAAVAQPAIISFTYSDLHGSFDSGSGQYTAAAGSMTSGDVTRLDSNSGSAEFDAGSFPAMDADFVISLTVSNIGANLADGNGTLTITDANGDEITADINGHFVLFGGSIFFEGMLSNAFVVDNSSDSSFDGTSSGAFSSSFFSQGPFTGSVVELFFNPGSFFANSFSNQTTLASGLLVPAPGAAALALMGGAIATRRRRA